MGGVGVDWVWVKFLVREGLLGWVRVEVVVVVGKLWNWVVRFFCCLLREVRVVRRVVDLLVGMVRIGIDRGGGRVGEEWEGVCFFVCFLELLLFFF